MDANYIIDRLKSTLYKHPTVTVLRSRLNNLDEERREAILTSLKKQIHKERNYDIQDHLQELVYRMPIAS